MLWPSRRARSCHVSTPNGLCSCRVEGGFVARLALSPVSFVREHFQICGILMLSLFTSARPSRATTGYIQPAGAVNYLHGHPTAGVNTPCPNLLFIRACPNSLSRGSDGVEAGHSACRGGTPTSAVCRLGVDGSVRAGFASQFQL
eukprot:3936838-Rhodomonas_salina.7